MEHPVKVKLSQIILPYMISAEKLGRQPFYLIYACYSYSRDLLAGFVGVGLSAPVMVLLAKGLGVENKQVVDTNLANVIQNISVPWKIIVFVAVGILVTLKIYISKKDGERLATLARSCRKEFRAISTELITALTAPDPMPGVIAIQNKITEIVQRYVAEDAWPWSPFPGNIDDEVRARTEDLVRKYRQNWAAPSIQSTPSVTAVY